jgi:hypothetical protein
VKKEQVKQVHFKFLCWSKNHSKPMKKKSVCLNKSGQIPD